MASSPAPLSEETDAGEDERRRRAALLVPPVSVEAETGERAGEDGRPRRTALHRRRLVAPPLVSVDDAAPRERTTDEDGRRRRATLVAGGLLVASSLSDDDEMSMTECTLEPEWKDAMAGKDCGRMGWDGMEGRDPSDRRACLYMEHAVNEKTKKWRARCFSSESRQEAPALLTFFLFFSLPRESAAIETNPPLISGLLR